MTVIHPTQDANSPESVSSSVSAHVTLYSWDFTNFVMFYQDYDSYGARILAINLANIYRETAGSGFITQVELARRMNISDQQVRVLLKEVESTGYWIIKRGSYSKREATQYSPTAVELERAKRWKTARFDERVSFTDPIVPAKTSKTSTRAAQGFTTPEALSQRKSTPSVKEAPYEFLKVEVPEWGQASQPQSDDTEPAWDTSETPEPTTSNEHTAPESTTQPEPQDIEHVWDPAAQNAAQPAVNEYMDPFAGPQSNEPDTDDTAWEPTPEPDDDLDAFGNPYVIQYDTPNHNPRSYL